MVKTKLVFNGLIVNIIDIIKGHILESKCYHNFSVRGSDFSSNWNNTKYTEKNLRCKR